jgi:hypothetical protein
MGPKQVSAIAMQAEVCRTWGGPTRASGEIWSDLNRGKLSRSPPSLLIAWSHPDAPDRRRVEVETESSKLANRQEHQRAEADYQQYC